jgi:hypothetical protein
MYLVMVAGTDLQLLVLHAYQSPTTVCGASVCAFTITKYIKQKKPLSQTPMETHLFKVTPHSGVGI